MYILDKTFQDMNRAEGQKCSECDYLKGQVCVQAQTSTKLQRHKLI